MSTVEGSGYGSGVAIPYDYGTEDKSSGLNKPPMFNGDSNTFSWWKTKMSNHIMNLDEEQWNILEDGVDDLMLDEEGAAIDRKKHIAAQKKMYKKHQKIIGILVVALLTRSIGR